MPDVPPDLELLAAVLVRLRADATLVALVGTRIFDRVPQRASGAPDVASPYIALGPSDEVPADADCIDAVELTFQIDAFSWGADAAFSSDEVRRIARAVRRSLHDAEIDLTTNALATLGHRLTTIRRDRDGITNHAVVQFTAVIESPDSDLS